ncbi:MAG: DEAD/DEAH box helicase [Gammaproteobacteria bacterium]
MNSSVTGFGQLALAGPVLQALQEIGYESPSPIQAESIPPLLEGRDLFGQAQTGTGKTAAFALPLLSRLDLDMKQPQVLVLTPTRELAIQVAEAFQAYARHMKEFHVLPIYGGQSMDIQLRQLRRGVHVVIGTPGRIMDHLRRKSLVLDTLRTLVLDEADEMLRMGFIDDVEWILEHTPAERQTALFSATMPEAIRRVAQKHLRDPREVRIKSGTTTVSTTKQRYWQVSGLHKLDALTRILEVEDFDAVLIFVRTKTETVSLAEKLEARGFAAAALNGDMNQALRERTIEQLKNEKLDIVVATDVAARGLDVQRISLVFNYDIPCDTESYVHRIGRTGRAGRTGSAILFVSPREMRMLRAIEKATRQPIEAMHLPSGEAVTDRRVAQFKQQIIDVIESEDLGFLHQVVSQIENEQDLSAHEIAAAMAYLLQRERPLQLRENREAAAPRASKAPPSKVRPDTKERRSGKPERARKSSPVDLVRYRIEVGRRHEATPGDIVGAIANEAGIDSQFIGQIKLHDDYSTVDLPDGMPQEVFRQLKQVRVRQQKLNIRRDDTVSTSGEGGRDGDRPLKVKASTTGKSRFNKVTDKPAVAKARRASQPVKEKKRRQLHLPR